MADKYWWPSGGTGSSTGNWASTTNWSSSSASYVSTTAPTNADSANFGSYSGASAFTVTIAATASCFSLVINNANMILSGSSAWSIYGAVTVTSFSSRTYTGAITFASTSSFSLNFGSMTLASALTFNGSGGTWTLGAALSTTGAITLTNGTLDTSSSGNYSLTASGIALGSGTKTLSLNASTVTLSGTTPISFATNATGFTFNAGTSQINCSSASPTFAGNNNTFYNVNFTSASITSCAITGANTYQNFTFASKGSTGLASVTFAAGQTINGSFTVTAPSTIGSSRYLFGSTALGIQRTITAGSVSLTDVDFRDTNNTGSTWTGTRLGDAGGNSGITFPATKTVYWNLAGAQNWSATGWATTSSGTPDNANFPLAQDTAIFTNTNPAAGVTVTVNSAYNLPTIDFSSRTNALTFATGGNALYAYGSITLSSAITPSGTGFIYFNGRNTTQTIICAGQTWTQPIYARTIGGSLVLGDAFFCSNVLTVQDGTLTATTYNVTIFGTTPPGSSTRVLNMGSGTWTITGTPWSMNNGTNLTINAETSTINMTSASAKTFVGGNRTYYNLNQGGAGALTISGNNTFNNLTNTVTPATVTFTASSTNTFANFNLNGTVGNLVTINSSTAGTRANIVKTGANVSCDYLNIKDLAAS